jgi:phosphopantothenoylcysteine synthetase/decarboxylase
MRFLVTAGNTQTLIDKVRCITNIFSGRTGGQIAVEAHGRGHAVTLLTSHPETLSFPTPSPIWRIEPYRTFEEFASLLEREVRHGAYDVVVHAAAVSDFLSSGVYVPAPGTTFETGSLAWKADAGTPQLADATAGKVKSKHAELWLRLTPAPKLVDRFRSAWGFPGTLVKFKLEVGLPEAQLLAVAEESRQQSRADWMVANTLEGMHELAFVGPVAGQYEKIERSKLAGRLLDLLEA